MNRDTPAWPCVRAQSGGRCRLDLSVSPNAMRTALDGLHDGALRLHLAAPPVDGKANQRLIVWLAAELGRAQRALRIAHRESSRRKTVEIDAVAERVLRWLDASSVASPREPPVSTSDEGPT